MRLAWATDVHLDFITNPQRPFYSIKNMNVFCGLLSKQNPDAVLFTGDISLSNLLINHLDDIESHLQIPVYFVLGNHDFWGSNFNAVRKKVTSFCNQSQYMNYLSTMSYVMLNKDVALVGHDGWYDALNGDFRNSSFIMNDWSNIGDFANVLSRQTINYDSLLMISRNQASIASYHISLNVKSVISEKSPSKIIIATHVPPFVECLNSQTEYFPWYSSKLMGDTILQIAKNNPSVQFEILSGHCHKNYQGNILPNLLFKSGQAEYGNPFPQQPFNV